MGEGEGGDLVVGKFRTGRWREVKGGGGGGGVAGRWWGMVRSQRQRSHVGRFYDADRNRRSYDLHLSLSLSLSLSLPGLVATYDGPT